MLSALSKIYDRAKQFIYRPRIVIQPRRSLRFRGSIYGGWMVDDQPYLHGSTAISCGLGEDASFDVEFASTYGATVIIVDPTPRAVQHFEKISARLGASRDQAYVQGGNQPVGAYDLSQLTALSLQLDPRALWITTDPVRFYEPENAAHVSHSITMQPKDTSRYIEVPATTIDGIIAQYDIREISVLKMDIEGAEISILETIATWPMLPRQLLIEFDALRIAGAAARRQVEAIDKTLRALQYQCCHFDGNRNYVYVRDNA